MYPKITIITPSYNQGQYIEQTITSVLNQNYPNLEYIIIDGGSTDNTVEIIKKYEDRIAYWVSEKDHGQSDAINKGYQKASGDIINWLNSDDYMNENALLNIAESFQNSAINGITTLVHNFEEEGEYWHELTTQHENKIDYITQSFNNQPGTFFRKKVWDKYFPLPHSLHYTMDQYLWFCYWLENEVENFKTESYKTIFFRRHKNSKTSESLKEFTFNKLGQVFFNEHNLIFYSFFRQYSYTKYEVLASYFTSDFKYQGKALSFPQLAIEAETLDLLFNKYLLSLLKEDFLHGFFDRLTMNLKYINTDSLDNKSVEEFNKLKTKALFGKPLQLYRRIYWKFKKRN